ncbi:MULTISPECIES: aminotransferase class IV [Microvirga]|uniref:aminotransferase class IV n=1 Tax=Microvirga TaxID=186650 RepID=UPI001B3763EA|nr:MULTISPECIES: aminotransferase class IV [unclassified Microvirga]MBQ0819510.1 aminotransferase class IV [Microvirga sp. HBU67558]
MKVWLNGTLCSVETARIVPTDRGLMLGDGLFETILVQAGQPRRLVAHLARLHAGARVIGLALPPINFTAAFQALLDANSLSDGSLRLTITRGSGPRGILPPADPQPTILITAYPLAPHLASARCVLARCTRRNEYSPLAGVKSLNCLDNVLARREAAARGADDAILCNTAGLLAEATAANLFLVRGRQIMTPPLGDGALPGVMRAAMLDLGAVEMRLSAEDILDADEAFLTSSLGMRGVCQIEQRRLREQPSPMVNEMVQAAMASTV